MATCPNKNTPQWSKLVAAQGTEIAYYLWDKYQGEVPDAYFMSLNQKLINGFLKDFNIDTEEFEDLKSVLGFNAYSASDLITKAIAYQKGESITPEVAYFAFSMLGRQNNKIRSELRYLIGKWDKFDERFKHHKKLVEKKHGFISDRGEWLNLVRDNVVLDFLKEKLEQHYIDPQKFEKSLDSKWTKEDFSLWNKFIEMVTNFLSNFSEKFKPSKQKLENLGIAIADEILNKNYEYFDYNLKEDQIQKYYKNTIESDQFAKELVEFGQKELSIVLTGSLALRRAGTVYRTADETLHDIDWVIPYSVLEKELLDELSGLLKPGTDKTAAAALTRPIIEKFEFFKKFKDKYPSYTIINNFYGGEHDNFESFTVQGVINGEFYDSNGTHEEEISYYRKDPETKKPTKIKEKIKVKHKKGDWIKDTGYVIDFFIRLQPLQEEHENYFKLWKEIMIAKLKMGRDKDFIDWKAFVPYLKSQNSFNFNYEGFRHFNYDSNPDYALEDATASETIPVTEVKPDITDKDIDNLPPCG